MWVRPWLERRIELGQYTRLMEELRVEDVRAFKNFLRMDPDMFQEILQRLVPRLTKIDTFCRKALSPGLKLAFTLRYLASGDNYHSLMYSFRVPHNTISKVIPEVCEAIIAEFAEEVIECPTTEQQWRGIADQFSNRWQFQHSNQMSKECWLRVLQLQGVPFNHLDGSGRWGLQVLVGGRWK